MIKNITDTSIEIPKETEVIDVCKSMSKVRLVQKGDLKIERAAVNVQMTVEQLRKMMEKTSV